jgi:hypothetical protein
MRLRYARQLTPPALFVNVSVRCPATGGRSGQDVAHHPPLHVGQAEIAPGVAVG